MAAKTPVPEQIEYLKDRVFTLNTQIQLLSDEKTAAVWPEMKRLLDACDKALAALEKA